MEQLNANPTVYLMRLDSTTAQTYLLIFLSHLGSAQHDPALVQQDQRSVVPFRGHLELPPANICVGARVSGRAAATR
jgi:hypothetical protein